MSIKTVASAVDVAIERNVGFGKNNERLIARGYALAVKAAAAEDGEVDPEEAVEIRAFLKNFKVDQESRAELEAILPPPVALKGPARLKADALAFGTDVRQHEVQLQHDLRRGWNNLAMAKRSLDTRDRAVGRTLREDETGKSKCKSVADIPMLLDRPVLRKHIGYLQAEIVMHTATVAWLEQLQTRVSDTGVIKGADSLVALRAAFKNHLARVQDHLNNMQAWLACR